MEHNNLYLAKEAFKNRQPENNIIRAKSAFSRLQKTQKYKKKDNREDKDLKGLAMYAEALALMQKASKNSYYGQNLTAYGNPPKKQKSSFKGRGGDWWISTAEEVENQTIDQTKPLSEREKARQEIMRKILENPPF